ncbi:MAG: protein kinase [Deltaproteobacteria bacterium]|nr:protein kinase [Deltaproteobacteria bacterium]
MSDEELGRTATAPGSTSAPSVPATPVGSTLGRYRLERELGAGGMGVVHAAFDPDLERRIALKVLRNAAGGDEAQRRLLREARAMARLAHTNVVTVHEVGSANGRDFVAMELIEGETLADWLRAAPRRPDEIVAAFVAAGRGLAAAHEASIVHRDFKPHNVLRSHTGRIVVTDFGLAREAQPCDEAPALAMTQPAHAEPSSLSALTLAGAVLGTPAYMAPEQWSGGAVTPATDQFAFCVALWEALAGERPYRGPTVEDLRAQVRAGPSALDGSKIPRRLRSVLRRGLDPEPDRRWPDLNALLAQLEPTGRGAAIAIGGGIAAAAVVGTVAFFALRRDTAESIPPPIACRAPRVAVESVWSAPIAEETKVKLGAGAVKIFEAEVAAWRAAREQACAEQPVPNEARLDCLDGVLARLDVLRRAYAQVPSSDPEDVGAEIVASSVCQTKESIPVLSLASNADNIAAYEWFARSETRPPPREQDIAAFANKAELGACAKTIALMAFDNVAVNAGNRRAALTDAVTAAENCDDARVRVDALIQSAMSQYEVPIIGPRGEAALRRAHGAGRKVAQPDLDAFINQQMSRLFVQRMQWDDAFRALDQAVEGFGSRGLVRRQLFAVGRRNATLLIRSGAGDLERMRADVAKWKPIAVERKLHDVQWMFERQDAIARMWQGEAAAAHAELLRVWHLLPHPPVPGGTPKVEGTVVDETGAPVAGAIVASAAMLVVDEVGPVPIYDLDGGFRTTTTDASGKFVLEGTSRGGTVVAQLGDRRSLPAPIAPAVKLALAPTRTITGTVALGDTPPSTMVVTVDIPDDPTHSYRILAPIGKGNTYRIAGAPRTRVRIGVGPRDDDLRGTQTELVVVPAGAAPVEGLRLALAATGRPLDVVTRSALSSTLEAAQVIVVPGRHNPSTVGELMSWSDSGAIAIQFARPIIGETVPPNVATRVRRGDLIAHFGNVPKGDITVCAIGLNADLADAETRNKLQAAITKLALKCTTIGPDVAAIELEAPPQQRIE